MQSKKIIFLPIETKAREYHAKALFALYAIRAGYQVIIGSSVQLKRCIDLLPKGVYIGTSIAAAHNVLFNSIKKSGHEVTAFDEEGLVYHNKENFIKNRINADTLDTIRLFFTWGQNHTDLVRKKSDAIKNYVQTGSMRFELLKPKYRSLYEDQISDIRGKYGDFILINTNLGMYNNLISKEYYYQVVKTMISQYDASDESFYEGKYLHQKEIFESYKDLISYLAGLNPDINIVIRPHPSERLSSWKDLESRNVFVANEGNVIPWISASKLVIQKNCTTSVEAIFLDKPVITYSVRYDARYDNEITNALGLLCQTKEEVALALDNIGSIEQKLTEDKTRLNYYVENMAEEENADLAILSALDAIDLPVQDTASRNYLSAKLKCRLIERNLRSMMSSLVKKTNSRKNDKQKFPDLKKQEFLEDLRKLCPSLGLDMDTVNVTKLYNRLYHLNTIDTV